MWLLGVSPLLPQAPALAMNPLLRFCLPSLYDSPVRLLICIQCTSPEKKVSGALPANNAERILCVSEQSMGVGGTRAALHPHPWRPLWPSTLVVLWSWHPALGDPSPPGDHPGIPGTRRTFSSIPPALASGSLPPDPSPGICSEKAEGIRDLSPWHVSSIGSNKLRKEFLKEEEKVYACKREIRV